jgi:hypothetical protein
VTDRRDVLPAVVNAFLVIAVPVALTVIGPFDTSTNTSATVVASVASVPSRALFVAQIALPILPFAAVAGWRTYVHAKRSRELGTTGWRGVAEAGVLGLGLSLLLLLPGTVRQPSKALPYLIVYGAMGLVSGLAVGLVLKTVSTLTSWLQARYSTAGPRVK